MRIEPTSTWFYSHTLCPCSTTGRLLLKYFPLFLFFCKSIQNMIQKFNTFSRCNFSITRRVAQLYSSLPQRKVSINLASKPTSDEKLNAMLWILPWILVCDIWAMIKIEFLSLGHPYKILSLLFFIVYVLMKLKFNRYQV